MNRRKDRGKLYEELLEFRDCSSAGPGALRESVAADPAIARYRPERRGQIDPRNGERVLYSNARRKRPHDTGHEPATDPYRSPPAFDPDCPVCSGKTTGVLDLAPLAGGHATLINKNLFPIAYPFARDGRPVPAVEWGGRAGGGEGFAADGCHYLQWTHTRHDRDFHNASIADLTIVLERLAAFERALHETPGTPMPLTDPARGLSGHVGVIKNFGRLVGGSLVHGHQQILHSNVLPRRIEDDRRFLERHGRSFAGYLAERNPPDLTIREYDRRVRLVTPFFMKRPLEATALVLSDSKSYLQDLGPRELRALARALSDVTRAAIGLMPALGREVAYNLVFHTGPIGGLYVEMLPFTQAIGGYEQLGIYICVMTPEQSTRRYVEFLG